MRHLAILAFTVLGLSAWWTELNAAERWTLKVRQEQPVLVTVVFQEQRARGR